ncbi:MAG: hypothetical protein ACTTK5_03500 [Candidatus Fimenecus sp.]
MKKALNRKVVSILLSIVMLIGICVPAFAAFPNTLYSADLANTNKTLDQARALIKASTAYSTLDSTPEGKVKQEVAASIIKTYTTFVPKTNPSQNNKDLYTILANSYYVGTDYGYAVGQFLLNTSKNETGFGHTRFLNQIVEDFNSYGENSNDNLPKLKDYTVTAENFTPEFLKECAKVAADVLNENQPGSVGEAFANAMGTWYKSNSDKEKYFTFTSKAETSHVQKGDGRLSLVETTDSRYVYIGKIIDSIKDHQPGNIRYTINVNYVKETGEAVNTVNSISLTEGTKIAISKPVDISGYSKNVSGAPTYSLYDYYKLDSSENKDFLWATDYSYVAENGQIKVLNSANEELAKYDATQDVNDETKFSIDIFANYQTNFNATINGYTATNTYDSQIEGNLGYGLKGQDLGKKLSKDYFANRPGYDFFGVDINEDGKADFDAEGNPCSDEGNAFVLKSGIVAESVYSKKPTATFYKEDGTTVIATVSVSSGTIVGKSSGASATVAAPEKEGFEFSHWAIKGTTSDATNIKITKDVSLVAIYKSTQLDPLSSAIQPIIQAIQDGKDAKEIVKLLPPVLKALVSGGYGDMIKQMLQNQLPEGGLNFNNGGATLPNDILEKLKAFIGKLSPNDGNFSASDIAQMLSALPQVASRLSKAFAELFSSIRSSIANALSRAKMPGLPNLPNLPGIAGGLGGGLGGILDKVKGLLGMGGGSSTPGGSSKTGNNQSKSSSKDKSFKNIKTGDVSLYALSTVAVVSGIALVLTKKKKNDD